MSEPKRIQRKRTKGWRMPEGAVYVGRPTRWGNPWRIRRYKGFWFVSSPKATTLAGVRTENLARREAVDQFRDALNRYPWDLLVGFGFSTPEDVRHELAGRDLACWCPLDQPCHADVLLEIANDRHSVTTGGRGLA